MSVKRRPTTAAEQCPVCNDLLGPLKFLGDVHEFCSWATAADWIALKPWLDGTLKGVQVGGA